MLLSALIEHPDVGLILYDAGCAEDLEVVFDSFLLEISGKLLIRFLGVAGSFNRCFPTNPVL